MKELASVPFSLILRLIICLMSETEGELSAMPEKSASAEKASVISIALSGSLKSVMHFKSMRGMSKATF